MLLGASDTHVVGRGDTLSVIAEKYGTSVRALKSVNSLKSDTIRIGQKLTVSGSAATAVHIVTRGESLSTIARQYGTSVRSIRDANSLKSDLIRIGQKLNIPSGSVPSSKGPIIHVVRRGENLSLIAQIYGSRVSTIKKTNLKIILLLLMLKARL